MRISIRTLRKLIREELETIKTDPANTFSVYEGQDVNIGALTMSDLKKLANELTEDLQDCGCYGLSSDDQCNTCVRLRAERKKTWAQMDALTETPKASYADPY